MTPEQEILADNLAAVRQQAARFASKLKDHAPFLPIDPSVEPQAAVRVNITAFIKRFELMQDQVSRKLFRSVLAVRGVLVRASGLAQVVGAMAELGIIDDLARWRRVTELRNIFAHDYMLAFEVLARLVNEAWQLCPSLIEMVSRVERYVAREQLLEERP